MNTSRRSAADRGMARRLTPWLQHRRLPGLMAALTVLLTLPALAIGWNVDDWVHQALIQRKLPELMGSQPLLDMFRFMDGDAGHTAFLRDLGVLSWWAPDTLRASFWRPITVLTHLLDDALLPGQAWFAHAHSIAWGAALVAVATVLFRRLHGPGLIAGLAALLYAVDDARAISVGWVANRNALVATVFGLLAIAAHHRWRRDGWRAGAVVGPLLLLTGLLSAEAALAATAYLFAYALYLDSGTWRARMTTLLPYAGTVIGWRMVYNALGYGASGSGLYLDPAREPLRYASAALGRLPVLLGSQWSNVPSVPYNFASPPVATAWALGALLGLALLTWVFRHLLRSSPTARFYGLGMVLAALPVCATMPTNRLLTFVGFGGAGLLSQWLVGQGVLADRATADGHAADGHAADGHAADHQAQNPQARQPWLARAMVVLHLGVSPLALAGGIAALPVLLQPVFHACADALPDEPALADQTIIFVNSNDLCTTEIHFMRAVRGQQRPRRVRLLTSALYDIEVHGVDQRTIEVRPEGGWHSNPADSLLRSGDDPLPVGAHVTLAGLDIEIMAHNAAGFVSAARFRFDVPLSDPSLRWLATRKMEPTPFTPPAAGEVVRLARHF